MGLDSIWMWNREIEKDGVSEMGYEPCRLHHLDPSIDLIQGILGFAGEAFRGKVYNDLIEKVSGISLYQEEVCNRDCRKISEALDACKLPLDEVADLIGYSMTDEEAQKHLDELRRMFREYSKVGAVLVGWW